MSTTSHERFALNGYQGTLFIAPSDCSIVLSLSNILDAGLRIITVIIVMNSETMSCGLGRVIFDRIRRVTEDLGQWYAEIYGRIFKVCLQRVMNI